MTQELTGRLEVEDRGAVQVVRVDGGPHALFGLDLAIQLEELVERVDNDPDVHATSGSRYTRCEAEPTRERMRWVGQEREMTRSKGGRESRPSNVGAGISEGLLTPSWLRHEGFSAIRDIRLRRAVVSPQPGVYVVLRDELAPVDFLSKSTGGWFKGRDPSAPAQTLATNWVGDAYALYIGKADAGARG